MLRRVKRPHSRLSALLRAATRARRHAYAPYSGFQVGAAVLAGGRIFSACNVENSAYPLSVCAERNAVGSAVAAGHRRIDAVAIVAGEGRPAAPCGGCRQVFAEFCDPDAPVVYASTGGRSVITTAGALLPDSFGPADLLAGAPRPAGIVRDPSRSAARIRGTRKRRK
jgi:cytidine deaminase